MLIMSLLFILGLLIQGLKLAGRYLILRIDDYYHEPAMTISPEMNRANRYEDFAKGHQEGNEVFMTSGIFQTA
jgi:hypothetical protein